MIRPQSASESDPASRNLYQCGTCSQSYARIDHLRRHVLSHTQEKPHQCTVCSKRFGRIDLLRRHSALHAAAGSKPALKRRSHHSSPHPLPRTSQACSACADDHLRCDEEKPCARCRRRKIECVAPPKSTDRSVQSLRPSLEEQPARETSQCMPDSGGPAEAGAGGTGGIQSLVPPPVDMPTSQPWSQEAAQSQSMELGDVQGRFHSGFVSQEIRDELATSSLFTDTPSGVRTPRGLITFALPTDLDLNMVDLSFLESYNSHIPFEFDEQVPSLPITESPSAAREPSAEEGNGRDARSMQHLRWRFVPAPQDHGYCEHGNLLLPTDASASTLTPPQDHDEINGQSSTEQRLDLSSRDRILGIVLSQMKHPISAVLSSFPSVQLLESLIRYYLTAPFSSAHSWIHRGTFSPQKVCPELLLAMAAAGAVITPDPSLRKLGFAMQEVVRLQLPSVFEGNNTTIRDLHLHQAYLLYLEIGLWSGNSRKIEIAEAFRQPLVTMVRRGGMFHHSAYPPLPVRLEETGQCLGEAWHAWAYKEAYKRLAYRLFRLEAQVSMALLTAPLITYAEMSLPLPAASHLWNASSASQWKEAYNNASSSPSSSAARIPTLGECVADLDLLESSRRYADIRLACGAVLHSIWGLVWEYRQLSSLLAAGSRYWDNDLLKASRHGQLRRILDCFRMAHGSESPVQLHLILMHTYMSLEEVEVFATADDPSRALDESARALQDWVRSEQSRHAIWHAGQVVRQIKLLSVQKLRDFMAIALYHASLTLWAYGMVYMRMTHPDKRSVVGPLESNVRIDGPETEDVHRYIALQRGIPTLHGPGSASEAVFAGNPTAVLDTIIEVMQQNHYHEVFTQTPPLVANLIHLLERLRDASK